MRLPSEALARMPPAWTFTLHSPSSGANSSASSPSTNTGVWPSTCTPTIVPPVSMRRTRPASEGSGWSVVLIEKSGYAALETLPDLILRQIAADEDDAAQALLAVLPRALMIAVEDHVHALEDEALGIVLERQDALAAENLRTLLRDQILHPGKELVRV